MNELTEEQEKMWDKLSTVVAPGLLYAPPVPLNGKAGDVYLDSDTNTMHVYTGTYWEDIA